MYGFPLIVWSSGGLQVHRFGMPGIGGVLAYAGGALAAMTIVVVLACGGLSACLPKRDPSLRAFGGIHIVSVLGSVIIGWAVALPADGVLAFLLSSFVTVVIFEVLLSLELHMAAGRSAGRSEDE
jgi:hypothetical protein